MKPEGREPPSNREALELLFRIFGTGEVQRLEEVMAPDVVSEYPQSGERIFGIENVRQILMNYPGGRIEGDSGGSANIIGGEERYMLTPTFNMVKVHGGGDTLVGTAKLRYPDGSDWYVIAVAHFHDGMIVHNQLFFAPCFEAPEWRSRWVERVSDL
jgi:hypothetical protein